jgi:hypothetical protein
VKTPLFFRFDHYTVRRVEERDRAYLDQLTSADEEHRERMNADFFLQLLPGEDAWAVEDPQGVVVLYFKTQAAARIHMQFVVEDRELNRDILTKGMQWLEGMLLQNNFREMLFDTKGRELRLMAKRRLGFKDSPEDLSKPLPPPWGVNGVSGVGTTVQLPIRKVE